MERGVIHTAREFGCLLCYVLCGCAQECIITPKQAAFMENRKRADDGVALTWCSRAWEMSVVNSRPEEPPPPAADPAAAAAAARLNCSCVRVKSSRFVRTYSGAAAAS